MAELFETKIRKVGTSFGILLPKDIVQAQGLKEGEKIEVAIFNRKKKLIEKYFGMTKGAGPFERDHDDREV